jgi:hypothetical protein
MREALHRILAVTTYSLNDVPGGPGLMEALVLLHSPAVACRPGRGYRGAGVEREGVCRPPRRAGLGFSCQQKVRKYYPSPG